MEALVDIKPDLGGLSVGAAWGAKALWKDAPLPVSTWTEAEWVSGL